MLNLYTFWYICSLSKNTNRNDLPILRIVSIRPIQVSKIKLWIHSITSLLHIGNFSYTTTNRKWLIFCDVLGCKFICIAPLNIWSKHTSIQLSIALFSPLRITWYNCLDKNSSYNNILQSLELYSGESICI